MEDSAPISSVNNSHPPQEPQELSDDESVHGAPRAQPIAPQILVADSLVPRYYEDIGQYAIRVGDAFVIAP